MPRKTKPHKPKPNLAVFDEDTLDRLVEDALTRIGTLRADLLSEGMTVATDNGPKPNPKMGILRDEREWVRRAWSTKYQGQADGQKDDYFRAPPQA